VTDPDGEFGSSKSTRRFRKLDGLLQLTASYDRHLKPIIGFPDGRRVPGDDPSVHQTLSAHVGRPVQLLPEGAVSHFDEGPLHLVTTASLAALAGHHGAPVSTARLRSNLLVDVGTATGSVEDGWTGQTLAIGADLVIRIREPMPRCVMVDLARHELPPAWTTRSNSSPDRNPPCEWQEHAGSEHVRTRWIGSRTCPRRSCDLRAAVDVDVVPAVLVEVLA
jgi:hypothetical protein